ncbi:MAG: hypothetical protein ACOC78_00905 [Actinomycetota bacterium]
MIEIKRCPECDIPEPFAQGQMWLNNGDIVQRVNPRARIAFVERENLDPLFANIGDIIGVPIEPFIVNIAARGTERFMRQLIPDEAKEMIQAKSMQPAAFAETILTYCHIIGYGKYEFVDSRYERDPDDYAVIRIHDPFSVPEAAGAIAGVLSAMVGGEHAVSYEEISPGLYEFTTRWTEYPEVYKERLQIQEYVHKDEDIELEHCGTCGCPRALSAYRWDLDNGTIKQKITGKRMTTLGPELLDPVFTALEQELGEAIPRAVVEAQRRFIRTGIYTLDVMEAEEDLRTQLALRGLGNLHYFKIDEQGAHLDLHNPCLHLIVAGMVQGNFEMAFGVESDIEWELNGQGNLEVQVTPKTSM